VIDQNGVNRALNKPATQSSTYSLSNWSWQGPQYFHFEAKYAVDGSLEANSAFTNQDNGKYLILAVKLPRFFPFRFFFPFQLV
jgi:hypothetical protein